MKSAIRHALYHAALAAARATGSKATKRYALGILKLDRLGDAVLSLGAVRRLMASFDEAQTLLVVSDLAAPLFRAEFPTAAILSLPPFCQNFVPEYLALLLRHSRRISEVQVDQLVCLRHQPSDYLTTIAQLLRPRLSFASHVEQPWESVCLPFPEGHRVAYPAKPADVCNEIEAHRQVVQLALGGAVTLAEVLPVITCAAPVEGSTLLVCPDAGDAIRIYPPTQLAEAVALVLKRHSMPVEVCLPPAVDDAPWRSAFAAAGIVCQAWHQPPDVVALCRVLAKAGVVLGNDSAPAHIATAMNKRGIFLLGGGHFGMFAPWTRSQRQIWLFNRLDCYDCRWNCIHSSPLCITEIAPAQIAVAMDQVLAA